jgi:hypothetical protein
MSHTLFLFNTLFSFFRFLRRPSLGSAGCRGKLGIASHPAAQRVFFPCLSRFFRHPTDKKPGWREKNALASGRGPRFFRASSPLIASPRALFRMGYLERYGPSYSVIFGRAATMDADFTPLAGAVQMTDNLRALNSDLFGWPLSSWPCCRSLTTKPEDRKRDLPFFAASPLVVAFSFLGSCLHRRLDAV